MKPLARCDQARRLDELTRERASTPGLLLMEDASMRMYDALFSNAGMDLEAAGRRGARIVGLCGSGSNAGDALAILRLARFDGFSDLTAIFAKDEMREDSTVFAASLRALGVPLLSWKAQGDECRAALACADLILDGISGTGLKGALREDAAVLVEVANASAARRVAVDLPSGLCDEGAVGPALRAHTTLAIEPLKACMYYPSTRELCGRIVPVRGPFPSDIDVDAEAWLLEAEDLARLAPQSPPCAHKGQRGKVAVFAGSVGTSGAALLASRAVLAAGAGLSALFASKELLPLVAPALDSVMAKPEPEDFSRFDADSWDAVLVGPGWGLDPERAVHLESLLRSGRPMVVDADGLRLLASRAASTSAHEAKTAPSRPAGPRILTPHPGEFAALSGVSVQDALRAPPVPLRKAARDFGAVIILKSHVTWIASPSGELAVWEGMESALGTAGSGDVLAGLAAGLLARASAKARAEGRQATHAEAFAAARAAVIAHGSAGKAARAAYGWFEAGALIGEAAKVLGA